MKKFAFVLAISGLAFGCASRSHGGGGGGGGGIVLMGDDAGTRPGNQAGDDAGRSGGDSGRDDGPRDPDPATCDQEFESIPRADAPGCAASTLDCLMACTDADCQTACFEAEPDQEGCNTCLNQNINACASEDTCKAEWDAFNCCAVENGCEDQSCVQDNCGDEIGAFQECGGADGTVSDCLPAIQECFGA